MDKLKTIISLLLSGITAVLGYIGISGWCCTLAGAAVLSFFGLASFSGFITYHYRLFFSLTLIFLVLAGFSVYNHYRKKNNKSCLSCNLIKKKKTKNHV